MRKFLTLFLFSCLLLQASGKVYEASEPEVKPSFIGGDKAFYDFINNHVNYEACYASPLGDFPPIYVSVLIDSAGFVHNIQWIQSTNSPYESRVVEALRSMPRWDPGKKDGQYVNSKIVLTIRYSLTGSKVNNEKLFPSDTNTVSKESYYYPPDKGEDLYENQGFALGILIGSFIAILLMLSLAILPGVLIIMLVFYWRRKRPLRFKEIAKYFAMGMISVIPPAIIESFFDVSNYNHITDIAIYAFIVVGLVEESSKFFFLRTFAFRSSRFTEHYDGILFSVIISMGFATVENIIYTFNYGLNTAMVRMFTAVPAHASFAVIMGFFASLGKFGKTPTFWLVTGLVIATAFHGLYDFLLVQDDNPDLKWLTAGILILSIFISVKAIHAGRKLKIESKSATLLSSEPCDNNNNDISEEDKMFYNKE